MRVPSGLKLAAWTIDRCPMASARLLPESGSQMRVVKSADAVTTNRPSALNTADMTRLVCPLSTVRVLPELVSQTRAVTS